MTTIATPNGAPPLRVVTRASLLAHAQASPTAVAAKDKRAWLALFADAGSVHDPVGTPACARGAHSFGRASGPDDLERFYDCFIAPNTIRFEVHRDLVSDRSVVRDVTLHVTGPSGVPTAVAAHLVYTMVEAAGGLRIARMEAFWQPADVMRTVRRAGARGVAATVLNLWQLARSFGLAGSRAYLRGVRDRARSSVARDAVRAWIGALAASDEERAGWEVEADKILVCGWAASCSLHARSGDRERHGVAVFELARPSASIHRARLYWDTE
jgi:hypothetical protein